MVTVQCHSMTAPIPCNYGVVALVMLQVDFEMFDAGTVVIVLCKSVSSLLFRNHITFHHSSYILL